MDLHLRHADANRRRACRGRRAAGPAAIGVGRRRARQRPRRARRARRSRGARAAASAAARARRRCRRAWAGSARRASTTSARDSTCRRPTRGASRRSTRCSSTTPRAAARAARLRRHRVPVQGRGRADRATRARRSAPRMRTDRRRSRRDRRATPPVWMRSPCLGLCDHAPAAFVQRGRRRRTRSAWRASRPDAARWRVLRRPTTPVRSRGARRPTSRSAAMPELPVCSSASA